MKQDFETILKEMHRWNKQGWHKEQTHIGCALYELFVENYDEINEVWKHSESPESFHKAFRQGYALDYRAGTQRTIWHLISLSGHFWNAVLNNDPEFGDDVLDPFNKG